MRRNTLVPIIVFVVQNVARNFHSTRIVHVFLTNIQKLKT